MNINNDNINLKMSKVSTSPLLMFFGNLCEIFKLRGFSLNNTDYRKTAPPVCKNKKGQEMIDGTKNDHISKILEDAKKEVLG